MKNTPNPKPTPKGAGAPSKGTTTKQPVNFLFHRENYILMFSGIALLIIGYALMSGGHQKYNEWHADEIYSFRRITLAPITVVIGYLVLLYSIVRKPKN